MMEIDDDDESCPLCRGTYSDEFAEMILGLEYGEPMTIDEFRAWLKGLSDETAKP